MRIAIVIPWYLPNRGGAEIGAWEIARRLAQKDHTVAVITPRYRPEWPDEEHRHGITVLRYRSYAPSYFRRLSEAAHSIQAIPGVFRLLNRWKPNIVHLHYTLFTGYAAMAWSRKNRIPTILTLVGNDVYDPYYRPCSFLDPLNRWMIERADRVTAASSFVKNIVQKHFSKSHREIDLIPYGVDLNRFRPETTVTPAALRQQLELPADGPLILTVQRLHERKGVHVFIQAASRILREMPEARFVIVGGGPERERLGKLSLELGIHDRVRFAGRVPDELLPLYYQACDLFAFHTFHEGFGIVLLEAMASGKAVVSCRAGGTIDIIEEGINGQLIEPNDAAAMANAVLGLLQSPKQMQQIGIANRKRTETHFNWDTITDAYISIYNAATAPKEGPHVIATDHSTETLVRFLACPHDKGELTADPTSLRCQTCRRAYPVEDGIPIFLTEEDHTDQSTRGTKLFETTPEYFERLHTKRISEWGTVPYLSETFTPADSWALDVGCGSGTLVLQNAQRGISSIGMDISIHGARFGRDTARKLGLKNCFFVVGDACRLPFRTNQFRLVTNYTAIEHVYDHVECLKEMHRVTSPGGRMLVNTINNFSLRPENGWPKALAHLASEWKDYFRMLISSTPIAPPHSASPADIDYDRWKSGEEIDLYHARSYDLLKKAKEFFTIDRYTTYSYSASATEHRLTKDVTIQAVPITGFRRLAYAFLMLFNGVPMFQHMGRTITIIGRKN